MTVLAPVALDDRYTAEGGPALLTGMQALVRLFLQQRRLDDARGLATGAFVSGYPGSPLGGLDREVVRAGRHLEPAGVRFEAAVNEELAATAVAGTQLVPELPGRRVDGVTGYWYGKAPGLDRAADAIRHGNTSGTTHLGGAVALIGDDPLCKSSTLPSSCELLAESLVLPLFSPASTAEIVRLGLHAVAMSRHAGLWTAIKIISDVADSTVALELEDASAEIPEPPAQSRGGAPTLLGASAVAAERDLIGERLDRARDYGRDHALNGIVFEPAHPRTTVIAPGPTFATVARALQQLGLGDPELEELGIRLVRLDLVWPIHPDDIDRFVAGVEEVIVVEDKRPFVERQLRDALYGRAHPPAIVGKRDAAGRALVPLEGSVSSDVVSRLLDCLWAARLGEDARQRREKATARVKRVAQPLPIVRTPFFCSGCPHNLSTRSPDEQLVGAGIGCHALVAVDPSVSRGKLLGAPQMGGEGAQWIGMAPFTSDDHYVQNLGDGTFHHSGSLAIRAAVAAGVNVTYRLLYNDAIAMTGGQTPPGRLSVVELTRWLDVEGVRKIIVTTEEPESFAGQPLPQRAEIRHRDELERAQEELAAVEGVTVLLHTDRCATEERRLRKRGKLETPAQRVWINERVCEGCGDCGEKSSCLSVVPTETEFGRKTKIHQSSCTQDFACLEGDCPSFMLVTPGEAAHEDTSPPDIPVGLPDPVPAFEMSAGALVRMPGIGGTGVVTVSQILQMAALLEGKWASGLDQTGLAQKGGAVISDIRIAPTPNAGALRAAAGEVDVLLGLDLLGTATADTLNTLDPERTVAVVNLHQTPTAAIVTDVDAPPIPVAEIVSAVEAATRADKAVWLDAGLIAEQLFADHMPANMIMLGAAYQHGCLPVGAEAITEAIRLNGAGVDTNLTAFSWGRAVVVEPVACEHALAARAAGSEERAAERSEAVERVLADFEVDGRLRDLVALRANDLFAYQNLRYARRYVNDVRRVLAAERAAVGNDARDVTIAYATGLHKLMAYKDEYEVARLHLDPLDRARRHRSFGRHARTQVLLHPPVLRAMGLKRKLKLRRTAVPLFRVLRAGRRLRGTPLDPFGRAKLRRIERQLVEDYRALIATALDHLEPDTQKHVAALATLPDLVRGYEDIKLANVDRYRSAAAAALAELER